MDIGKIENLPEILLLYRRHSEQESITKYSRLISGAVAIRERQLKKLLTFQTLLQIDGEEVFFKTIRQHAGLIAG